MDSIHSEPWVRRVPKIVPEGLEHGKALRGCKLRTKPRCVPSSISTDPEDEERLRCLASSSLFIYFYLSGTKKKKEAVRPIKTQGKPCSKALEHLWNKVEHWNSCKGHPLSDIHKGRIDPPPPPPHKHFMLKSLLALVPVSLFFTSAMAENQTRGNSPSGKSSAPATSIPKSTDIPDSEEYRAFKERLVKAEARDSKSQYDIGLTYLIGNEKRLGVKKDESLAESWFLKAAKQGNISALSQLRMIHSRRAVALKNKGVNDTEEATECLKFRILLGDRSNSFMDMYSDSTKAEAKKRAAKFRSDNGLPEDPDSSRSAPPEAR